LFTLQYLLIRVMKNLDFINSEDAKTIMHMDQIEIPTFSARMAMCVLAAGPMVFVFPFFQKYFVKGLTMGSIKE
ncbi:MAG: carbohydrate ABC transporter permease, partial [Clostridiaceae bacterium]